MSPESFQHSRTVVHRQPSNQPEFVAEYAREVNDFLRDGGIEMNAFLSALRQAGTSPRRTVTARRPHRSVTSRRPTVSPSAAQ